MRVLVGDRSVRTITGRLKDLAIDFGLFATGLRLEVRGPAVAAGSTGEVSDGHLHCEVFISGARDPIVNPPSI